MAMSKVDETEAPEGYRAEKEKRSCEECDFNDGGFSSTCTCQFPCANICRKDGQNVIFKKVEE